MDYAQYIKQGLHMHHIQAYDMDIPYIHKVLYTVHVSQAPLFYENELNKEVPITIVDPELIIYE